MNIQERLNGGRVKRYHTLETLKENTVGQHTFNMLVIADAAFNGQPPPALMQAILYHDLHEAYTGDTPFYTKRDNPNFRAALGCLEFKVNSRMGIHVHLTPEEKRILRFIDMLEALSFLVDERVLGNTGVSEAYYKTSEALIALYPARFQTYDTHLTDFHAHLIDTWNAAAL